MRKTKGLNFDWYFIDNFDESYLSEDFDYEKFQKIMIPHTMKEVPYNYFNEKINQIEGSYFKEIEIDESALNNEIYLNFMGVMNKSWIYLNNQLIYTNSGGYIPFKIKINEYLKIGENLLFVRVDGREIKNIPPFGNLVDYLPFSGIYREVYLEEKPPVNLANVKFYSDDVNVLNQEKILLNTILKINEEENTYKIKLRVFDEEKEVITHVFDDEIKAHALLSIEIDEIERWSIKHPKLYNLELMLLLNDEVIDIYKEKFGFRTLMFTQTGFLLNNEKIKLIGLNRHQSYPYIGYAAPKSMQEMDALILKDLGVNIVRTSHYMQSDHFINKCDELGILVFEEIPGWNYIGDEEFKELSLRNLKIMIDHHFNHPSICLWGVRINESKDDEEFYLRTNELAKSIDPTRQTGGVRNFKKSQLLEDVYTYNDFSHIGNNPGLENPKKVNKAHSPYLVTEYNGHVFPTKKFDSEKRRIEHSLRHLNVQEYNHYYDSISGAIGWCMADYNTHFQFGSNDRICYHGVLDIDRIEKYAAYVYKSQKDIEEEVVLFIASNMIPGDYDLMKIEEIICYTNCDYIKVYKNDIYLDTYYPDLENYEYLPHPPIIIKDLIGQSLKENENFNEKDAKKIKELLLSYNKHGLDMPLKDKLKMLSLMMRKVIEFSDAAELFSKYLANQGENPTIFKFEGYVEDELVKTVYKGHMTKSNILIEPDRVNLVHGDTYDLVRVVVKMVDDFGNVLDYANESFIVESSDSLEVIGGNLKSLIGGSIGVYLKTKTVEKSATVKFKFNNYPSQELKFEIKEGILV